MFAADHFEPCDTPVPEGCNCEQALEATVARLRSERDDARDEAAAYKAKDREGYMLAQEVLQSVTLEEAKQKASIYLGLSTPF